MTDLTPQDWDRLAAAALDARQRAYAPYSKFQVGAAVLCADGSIVNGCNVENATYGATCCAERTALYAAVAQGRTSFRAMAIATDTPEPTTSCGVCRQVIAEFVDADFPLLFTNLTGDRNAYKLGDLLPHAFVLKER